MCRDEVQCIRETLVLIYQHMVLIDNPSALRLVGNQRERERGGGIERQSVREKEADDGEKRKDEFACGHPQEAGCFFFSHSQFLDNWATIILQGPIEFQHRFKRVCHFLFSMQCYYVHNKWCMFANS